MKNNNVLEELDASIVRLQSLRAELGKLEPSALQGWRVLPLPLFDHMLQFHREDASVDPKIMARALGGAWKRCGSSWEADTLGIKVVMHDAEPSQPNPQVVEL